MNRSATNPYDAPTSTDDTDYRRPLWVRNVVILNLILFLLPLLFVASGYIVLWIVVAVVNGGTFDVELIGVSNVTLWPLALYLFIPNLVLLCWMTFSSRRPSSTKQQD